MTNYVMLELLLTRPGEGKLVREARGLRLLVRRVRQACEADYLIHVETLATLSSEESPNLGQCGLLDIDYLSLERFSTAEPRWGRFRAALATGTADERERVCRVLLERVIAALPSYLFDPLTQTSDVHRSHSIEADKIAPAPVPLAVVARDPARNFMRGYCKREGSRLAAAPPERYPESRAASRVPSTTPRS